MLPFPCTGICTLQTEIRLVDETKWLNRFYRRWFLRNYLNHSILAIHPITGSEYEDLYRQAQDMYKFR